MSHWQPEAPSVSRDAKGGADSSAIAGSPQAAPWRLGVGIIILLALVSALALTTARENDKLGAERLRGGTERDAASRGESGDVNSSDASLITRSTVARERSGITSDLQEALQAWGRFAGNGRLQELRGWFAQHGPQYEQLMGEAERARENKTGLPYSFDLRRAKLQRRSPNRSVVDIHVNVTRPPERLRPYMWQVEMAWSDQLRRWLLWTVRNQPAR